MNNIIEFPDIKKIDATPSELLDKAKGWDFEDVIIIGFERNSQTVLCSAKEDIDRRAILEMSELLRAMYLNYKGWLGWR